MTDPTTPTETLLAEDLHKRFGPIHAVQGVRLRLQAGEIYALVGPDGAGKTTLMRLLCGVLPPDRGRVSIMGYDILREADRAREHVGYLSQRFSLYEELTVIENLRFFAEVRGLSRQEWFPRSMEVLEFVGLAPFLHRRAGHLSGGMKQKLGLATALVHRPRVLLLDEPTNGVDPITRQEFWQLLLRLSQEDAITVLVTTPYMDEAVRAHTVGFMRGGRILMQGAPEALKARFPYAVLQIRGRPLREWREHLLAQDWVHGALRFGDRIHVWVAPQQVKPAKKRVARLARHFGLHLEKVREIPPQLEDVFLAQLHMEEAGNPAQGEET